MNPFVMFNPMLMGNPFGMIPPMGMFIQQPFPETKKNDSEEVNMLKKMLIESKEANASLKQINFGQNKMAPLGGA